MDAVMRLLVKEEKKWLGLKDKAVSRLISLRAAIHALAGNGNKSVGAGVSKLRGKKLSAAHRRAIKRGIAKAKAAKA